MTKLSVDGPVKKIDHKKIDHSGLTGARWDMTIISGEDSLDVTDAGGNVDGRYTKADWQDGNAPEDGRHQGEDEEVRLR